MIRSELRLMLRRRLYQPTSGADDQWTDSELNVFLNEGYRMTCLAALQECPEEILAVSRRNLVASQHTYSWPTDMMYPIDVAILTGSVYKPLKVSSLADILGSTQNAGTPLYYARYGRWIYLHPAPAANLSVGLQLTYVPALGLSTDASIPQLPVQWHPLIAINAQILALGESSDQAQSAIAERNAVYADLLGAGRRATAGRSVPLSINMGDYSIDDDHTRIWR